MATSVWNSLAGYSRANHSQNCSCAACDRKVLDKQHQGSEVQQSIQFHLSWAMCIHFTTPSTRGCFTPFYPLLQCRSIQVFCELSQVAIPILRSIMCSLIGEQHLGMLKFDVAPARNLMSTVSSVHYRQLQSSETLKEQNFCITSHIPSISPTRSFRGPSRAKMRMARQRTSDKSLSCVVRVARLILAETTGLSLLLRSSWM